MKKFVFSILLCFLLSNVYSMPKYNIVDLGALGGNYSHAVDINDNNQIVGYSSTETNVRHAVSWENGQIKDLIFTSIPTAINNNGIIIATGLVYKNGNIIGLGTGAELNAINDNDIIVGYNSAGGAVWTPNGNGYTVGNTNSKWNIDINNNNTILGVTGWATQLESIVIGSNTPFLGVGGNVIAAVKLNDNNNFAGYCQQRVGYNNDLIAELPCYWSSPSNPINIGNLGGDFGRSTDLNNKGEVVGYSELANSNNHAFFYGDGNLIDLGTLGGDVSKAYSINENSWIVGYSTLITGEEHACLWIPDTTPTVPEPATFIGFLAFTPAGFMLLKKKRA